MVFLFINRKRLSDGLSRKIPGGCYREVNWKLRSIGNGDIIISLTSEKYPILKSKLHGNSTMTTGLTAEEEAYWWIDFFVETYQTYGYC